MSVPESLRFTYEDYVLLPEDRRYEVIEEANRALEIPLARVFQPRD